MSDLEKTIENRARVLLHLGGAMCMKHVTQICHVCGTKPKRTNGLGIGVTDLINVVPPFGRFLAIEMKRPETRNSARDEHQRLWMANVRKFGGVAGVATCDQEVRDLLTQAMRLHSVT